MSAQDAFESAWVGDGDGHFVDAEGRLEPLLLQSWRAEPDPADIALFLDPCTGPTLDIGCGPGRLVAALAERHVEALGIDVSTEAVRLTRDRGAAVLQRDVFEHVPGRGRWEHALLADGNIGIGGDPLRLLRRTAELLAIGGTAIVEADPAVQGFVSDRRRIRSGCEISEPFEWAIVGPDAVRDLAESAGMDVVGRRDLGGRCVVTLRRRG